MRPLDISIICGMHIIIMPVQLFSMSSNLYYYLHVDPITSIILYYLGAYYFV